MKSRIKAMYDAQLVENASLRARLAAALEDSARIDWLADPKNTIGNVQLPRAICEKHLDSLRAAIDEAMKL